MSTPDEYFNTTTAPANLEQNTLKIRDFINVNQQRGKKLVLVTSGGTTVPLESNTVRFLDNFSAGTRGATSAEYFIEAGYACIFLHRQWSLEPFTRHYTHSKNCFLDLLETKGDQVVVTTEHLDEIRNVMNKYHKATADQVLLKVDFTTVSDYLFLLQATTKLMAPLKSHAMFYLAAAVSDFFIPQSKMATHKIQSSDGGLSLVLDQVPKIIKPLVSEWAPEAYTVSFKLETDDSILISKAQTALQRYGHQLVIGNLLQTRKWIVWFITHDQSEELKLSDDDVKNQVEIEKYIIQKLIVKHDHWISKSHQ
ncbi:DNA/pantothenate metabolism flavoprotein [Globomyces pollinis-pini]|nr:DNA/pantothenate metabolism flavoprotein [Globomyces pollinis-pini]